MAREESIGFQQTKECVIENSIPAPVPVDFDMLSFGDSVMWGTGLLHQQKFRTLVEDQIKARYPSIPATANAYTHTGAINWRALFIIYSDGMKFQDKTLRNSRTFYNGNLVHIIGQMQQHQKMEKRQ